MKIILLAAAKEEINPADFSDFELHYSGVGKINAAFKTFELITTIKPDLIINIGTSGVLKPDLVGKVHEIGCVIERDAMCEPLSERGTFPFDNSPKEFKIHKNSVKLATGDSLVISNDPWLVLNKVDLVDMEFFAIAKVSFKLKVPALALKFGSDFADQNAHTDWSNSLKIASKQIARTLPYFLESYAAQIN